MIAVVTRAGVTKQERILKVIWTGPDKYTGVTIRLCAVVPRAAQAQSSAARASAGYWVCPSCEEENANSSSRCWECGCGRR